MKWMGSTRRHLRRASCQALAGLWVPFVLALALPAHAQSVRYAWTTPDVIPSPAPATLRFEAEIVGTPSRVVFEFDPGDKGAIVNYEMRDDGTGGDRVAGDGVYTATLPVPPLLAAMRPEHANRVFMGFLNVFNGSQSVWRGYHLAMVYTPELGTWAVTPRSTTVQHTTHVANVVLPSYFASINDQLPDRATREFYRWFGDDYDFVNLVYFPGQAANRNYSTVKMAIAGIGRTARDNTVLMGSAGRLLGMVQFPVASFFDGGNDGPAHELGHHWISGLDFDPLGQGIPHWPYSTMASGVMGISIGGRNGPGGTFTCSIEATATGFTLRRPSTPAMYNDLDLYLMGLMAPEEVAPQWVFVDQKAAETLPCTGSLPASAMTRVTVQDVVAKMGARSPSHLQAPRRFRVATLLVTRDGLASPQAMAFFSAMTLRSEGREPMTSLGGRALTTAQPFYAATQGRAVLHTHLLQDMPWVFRAAASGPLSARRLTATIEPAAADVGGTRQIFIAALVGANWYFLTPAGWQLNQGGAYPAYATSTLSAKVDLPLLDGTLNLTSLAGTRVYVGYGRDAAEMLTAGRYAMVHYVQ